MADSDGSADGGTGGDKFETKLGSLFSGATVVDPSAESGGTGPGDNSTPGDGPKKRGRPRGSTNSAKTKASNNLDLDGVEKLLLTIHLGLAAVLKAPEFVLDESEAKSLATAFARVSRHYPVLQKIGDKSIDHANLVTAAAGIYGTRIFAWNIRRAGEKARPASAQVITPDFRGSGPGFGG